jgi:hypothetical protein
MATTTPNFGWPVPTSTDLVKDGATAIEGLGDAIDASLLDLKGGTTGQVLAKASNTDMDFTWSTDASGISPTIFAAKGDLLGASANDTPAVLTVGANGETLVADSSTSTGLRYTANFAAGKNKIINGDFNIWQRGTSMGTNAYNSDRFVSSSDASVTISRQTFTPGTAPVAGYEGIYFCRIGKSAGGSFTTQRQHIENVQTFAGQTVVLSFWAKASTAITLEPYYEQIFGSGGSGTVGGVLGSSQAITTSWARYSFTTTLPSIAGKTIGTSSYLNVYVARYIGAAAVDIDIWGVQLEAGSVATAFQTATGTIQGELAACQRYFQQVINGNTQNIGAGWNYSSSYAMAILYAPVTMRVEPTIAVTSGTNYYTFERNGGTDSVNAFFGAANSNPNNTITLRNSTEISGTAGDAGLWFSNNASANISLSAEL